MTKTYEKAPPKLKNSINLEAKQIAETIKLSDRIESLAETEAFITIKDHKENFENQKPCRLLIPSKSEIGHVSKVYLDQINKNIRTSLKLNQWKNTTNVIHWFEKIENKDTCTFVQLDIKDFYPSITEKIFDSAINFAKKHTNIDKERLRTTKHCRKSLLFLSNESWKKRVPMIALT